MDPPNLPSLTLRFTEAGEVPHSNARFDFFQYSGALGKLIASDGWCIISIEPSDASRTVLHQTQDKHFVSCIHPTTGAVIFVIERYDQRRWDFFSLEVNTKNVNELWLPSTEGEPFWGLFPRRIIELANGERIYLCVTTYEDETEDEDLSFTHVDAQGKCLSWSDMLDPSFHFGVWSAWSSNGQAIFDVDGYGIYAWSFETHEVTLLAGSETVWGCQDGVGSHARFWRLKKPAVNDRYLFVRTEGPNSWQWRQVCVDLRTMRSQTVRFIGVEHDFFRNSCLTDNEIYVLQTNQSATQSSLRLFRAPLEPTEQAQDSSRKLDTLDLSAPVRPLVFRLAGGAQLQVDGRLLVARSAYFRDMLTSGLREDTRSEVDLTGDSDVDATSLSVILRHVLGGDCTWDGSQIDAELAFRVRALADRYRLPRLVDLAEAHLNRMMTPNTALMFLSRIVGSGGALEDACWALMHSDREGVLQASEHIVGDIIMQNPELAKQLILWQTGAEADPARRPKKRPRT